jgi:hypothetical protein
VFGWPLSSFPLTLLATSSSDPSILSKVLALATGDLGEFGLINPTRLLELERTICLLPALKINCYCIIINSKEKKDDVAQHLKAYLLMIKHTVKYK